MLVSRVLSGSFRKFSYSTVPWPFWEDGRVRLFFSFVHVFPSGLRDMYKPVILAGIFAKLSLAEPLLSLAMFSK